MLTLFQGEAEEEEERFPLPSFCHGGFRARRGAVLFRANSPSSAPTYYYLRPLQPPPSFTLMRSRNRSIAQTREGGD